MKFTERLKELRLDKKLTQKQLPEKVKTSDDCILSWEKGRAEPDLETLCKLADCFDCSTDYLLGRAEF